MADLYLLAGDRSLRAFVALFAAVVFFALTRTIFRTSIEASETEAYRRVAKGLRNPRRIRDAQLRTGFLTLTIVLSAPLWLAYVTLQLRFVLLIQVLVVLTTVVLYVLGCDPLPPCAGSVREWLRGIAAPRKAGRRSATDARGTRKRSKSIAGRIQRRIERTGPGGGGLADGLAASPSWRDGPRLAGWLRGRRRMRQ